MSIGVIGAGAFGTALAVAMARGGANVLLWGRNAAAMADMAQARENARYLNGIGLPANLKPTAALADLAQMQAILLTLPAQQTDGFLAEQVRALPNAPLVLCAKGIDARHFATQTDIAARHSQAPLAVLTGPGFAHEIARGLPAALVLACENAALGQALQTLLSTDRLRLYLSSDPTGAQLGGALKNVVAIAAGMAIGAGLGESARAGLVTRGFAEMRRLGVALGAEAETFAGLSGLGDLMLTCASAQSRNFAAGLALGQGQPRPPGKTQEGVATARAAVALGAKCGVEMPIAAAVAAVLEGQLNISGAMSGLLARPLKSSEA
ncbi:MAG: NAD(P)H-dependent glycerol-3-phosphate dehydrogenase [Paracoccaceae bacterium]